jgi:tRNA A-37 threonylcarbamoyl transferase component Bud32
MRLVWLVFLALMGPAALRAQSFCFYQDSDGSPKPIACPEASGLPAPPKKGLVWLAVGDHYDPKILLRWKPAPGQVPQGAKSSLELPAGFVPKKGMVQETPGINAYDFDSMQVQDGKAVPVAFHAPPKAAAEPVPGAIELQSAHERLANNDAMGAIADADASIEDNPTPQAYLFRAEVKSSLSDYKNALQDAEAGLKLAPRDPDLLVAKADVLEQLNKQKNAPMEIPDAGASSPAPAPAAVPAGSAPQAPRFPPPPSGLSIGMIGLILLALGLGTWGGFQWAGRKGPASPVHAYAALDVDKITGAQRSEALAAAARPSIAPSAVMLKARFELRGKVGVGGMGIVYDGFDHSLGRRVAIKQLRAELKDNPVEREGFLSEARIISHLSHPYIVGFHDVVEENGEIYLVFDFVDGKPLSQILAERKRLPLKECKQIFTYVCEAMACAHNSHVLHRDLKPSNIMVDKAGYAKVMDFGIAREAKDSVTRVTQSDMVGTPAYMAPEQHWGRSGKASDIYSLGICLYETMTGQLPFPGPDFFAQKERMKYPPPQFLAPELPKETELLFAATFAVDPKNRVADAAELLESLKSLKG